jgi:hypothetical protein
VFDGDCDNYGFDVTNHDSVARTVTLTVGNTAQPSVVIQPGQTTHLPLDPATEAATQVMLTDSDGTVIADIVVRFCTETVNTSVTINANTSYTLRQIAPVAAPPAPQHGTVVRSGKNFDSLRYTPDPCFSGIDSFGWEDIIVAARGTVTVHVLPGPCNVTVRRSATDCAHREVQYTASNPYTLPARIVVQGSSGPSDTEHFTVPAHTTTVIWRVSFDPHRADSERFTFSLGDPAVHLFTDSVAFPCPASAPPPSSSAAPAAPASLAGTGTATALPLGVGIGALACGAGLTILGARRRRPRG